ncbi:DUF3108 domain-containing protein [Caenimonas terrae]|uniref:DUF3108 domain-containing protein n=1 Tax=Caenimonas terrae TaxID=696074 RepID=A0ABW0NAZ3_9BURK
MARRNALIAALLLAVLLGHALVLQWLAWQVREPSALRLMAAPMLTRMLQQQAAPAPVPQPVRTARARRKAPAAAMQSVVPSVPAEATVTAAAPEPVVEPAPPAPEPVASEPAAATPTAVATADAPDAATASPTADASVPPTTDSVGVTADGWPIDTRLSYQVGGYYRGELHGNARVEWLRDGERYQTRVDISLGPISVMMTSQGQVRDKELRPSAYEESGLGKRRTVSIQDKVVLNDGSQVDRPDGLQDTASQFIELSHMFSSGQQPLEVGRSVSFWLARPGGLDYWTYDVTDKESLPTPFLGPVEAFHLKPRKPQNPRGNIMAEIWFAPTLQYLPIRIRVTSGDANLDLSIDKIEQR